MLELWSLFDFLMPGFLGTEKQFYQQYSKPILASKDPKCSPKEQEAGKALEFSEFSCSHFFSRSIHNLRCVGFGSTPPPSIAIPFEKSKGRRAC